MKKAKKLSKAILVIVIILMLLAAAGLIAFRYFTSKLNFENVETADMSSFASKGVTNILLIGVDNDNLEGMDALGNADGLIIASVNTKANKIVLTSLMRDIRANIPGGGRNKLTLVYHEGGTQKLIETVEQNFNIDIDCYVLVNYLSIIKIVDSVGGITLELTNDEIFYMGEKIQGLCKLVGADYSANAISRTEAGEITLNGIQTAAYLRIRYAGNADFERTERARRVILALKDKALDMGVSGLSELTDVILPCITTDMPQSLMLSMLFNSPKLLNSEIISERIPIDGTFYLNNEYGGAYVDIDFEKNSEYLHNVIYGR